MLARYFAARDVLQDFDFKAIKETKIEPLFKAWMALPEAQRAPMEVDLRAIGDMSNGKGVNDIQQSLFTHPVQIGLRAVGWPASEVAALNAARIVGARRSLPR